MVVITNGTQKGARHCFFLQYSKH